MVTSIIIKWGNKLKKAKHFFGSDILQRDPDLDQYRFCSKNCFGTQWFQKSFLFFSVSFVSCYWDFSGNPWKQISSTAFPHHAPVTNFALYNLPNRSRTQPQISRHLRSPFTFISPCSPSAPFPGLVLPYTTCVSSDNQVNIISESCPLLPCIWMSTRFAVICLATELNKLD